MTIGSVLLTCCETHCGVVHCHSCSTDRYKSIDDTLWQALAPSWVLQAACGALEKEKMCVQVTSTEVVLASRCKRKYANAHTYHVNSIALSSDQETFITADDLRINLWNLDISDQAFNVVDMKPPNMEELTEVRIVHACPSDHLICAESTAKTAA